MAKEKATIEALKKYLKKEPSVLLAFLFGSYAKGFVMKESDLDVAVYLSDKNKAKEDEIYHRVSRITGKEVDLVPLNQAPASLVSEIFKTGIPLAVKDKKLYWELFLQKSLEAEDFVRFAEDFWEISKKARSLRSEQKSKVLERLQFLNTEFKELEGFKKLTFEEYQNNKVQRRNIERWTESIINATIDIAKIVLAAEEKRMPRGYEEALLYFGVFVGLSKEEADELASFAGLRNILAHEYLEVLYGRIQDFIKESPSFYKRIFDFLGRYLK